jgi:hypothetical protein
MDYSYLLMFGMGLGLCVAPSLFFAMLASKKEEFNGMAFLVFFAIFSAICEYFAILPTWFVAISILAVGFALYTIVMER